jgi:hypothetical protein
MMPEVPSWVVLLLGGGGLAAIVTAVLVFVATRKRDRDSSIAGRFDDASELAKYIREEVERQVAPIRERMEKMSKESHEMNDAVRARETQLWLWNQRGRRGDFPMLPVPILHRLGIAHLADPEFDDTDNPYRAK